MLTCELDENGFEEFGNGKCAFCGREGHDGIIKIVVFFSGLFLLFLRFRSLSCSLSLLFQEKRGDFGIETGFGERIRDAYAKDGVGLRRR